MNQSAPGHDTPTVVLVHGGFADASCWNGVIDRLQATGSRRSLNPLRGLDSDTDLRGQRGETIEGPVLLGATPTAGW